MDAVIGKMNISQDSVLYGDHQITVGLPLADGLSKLRAGMMLYKTAGGYTPLPASYTTDQKPTAVLSENIDEETEETSAVCVIHGAVRAEKIYFADRTAVTAAAVELLRGCGIYAIGKAAATAQAPSVVLDLADASAAVGESLQLTFGVKVADGGTISYQWYRNTSAAASGGTAIKGETDNTLTVDTSAAGTLYYYCTATNTLGLSTAVKTSAAATVTVA